MAAADLEAEVRQLREELLAAGLEKDRLQELFDKEHFRLSMKLEMLRREKEEQFRRLRLAEATAWEAREFALERADRQDEEMRRIDHELGLDREGLTRTDGDRVRAIRELTAKWKAALKQLKVGVTEEQASMAERERRERAEWNRMAERNRAAAEKAAASREGSKDGEK